MHIGFLTPEFPHAKVTRSAGIGTSILNLATGLVKLGHTVSILVYGQKQDERFDENGMCIHLIKNVKLPGLSLLLTQKKIQKSINKLVRTESLDIVEAPDWTGITSHIKAKCPIVVKLHGSDTYFCHLDQRLVKPINKRREELALKSADAIASVSRFTADVTTQLFGLKKPIAVIPNGLDIDKFKPSDALPAKGTVLYFGTLIRKKGALELPLIFNELIKRNPEAQLLLVGKDSSDIKTGSASTWELMQPLFSSEAIKRVQYLGAVDYSEMRQKIEETEVCVFPTFAEALPVSWIEAMAMGKAVVASSIGWAGEIIDDGNDGFLVHPQHHAQYAEKIAFLLSDTQTRTRIGKKARMKAIASFSLDVIAKQNEDFYKSTVENYS